MSTERDLPSGEVLRVGKDEYVETMRGADARQAGIVAVMVAFANDARLRTETEDIYGGVMDFDEAMEMCFHVCQASLLALGVTRDELMAAAEIYDAGDRIRRALFFGGDGDGGTQ